MAWIDFFGRSGQELCQETKDCRRVTCLENHPDTNMATCEHIGTTLREPTYWQRTQQCSSCLVRIPSLGREEKQSLVLVATALMEKLESRFDSCQKKDLYTQGQWTALGSGIHETNAIRSHSLMGNL